MEAVYPELRQIAARHLRRERKEHTLQPTALVVPNHHQAPLPGEDVQVLLHLSLNADMLDLHHQPLAAVQPGAMNLGNRG